MAHFLITHKVPGKTFMNGGPQKNWMKMLKNYLNFQNGHF